MEKHYVYLKDNRVVQIAVFAEQNEELADTIAKEQGFDDALWIGENPVPHMWSEYNPINGTFTNPTPQYLYSIGVLSVDPDVPVEQPTE
jgi:hypothetical protein